MNKKKTHLIKFGPMKFDITDSWQTYCGEYFWTTWHGTTEPKDMTCKKCQKIWLALKDKDNE